MNCAATWAMLGVAAEERERAGAGDGFDAADAGGDGAFADEFDEADFAGGGVWVPPQSSVEKSPILTTRTRSPYFSPKSAMAPSSWTATSMGTSTMVCDGGVGEDLAVDDVFDLLQLFVGDAGEVGEVEAEAGAVVERAGLLDVGAEDLAQGGVEEVGAGVVAHGGVADFGVDDGVDGVADGDAFAWR